MPKTQEKFSITTPIYYVNDVPHIGHAYTTIAADVIARYKKLCGYKVYFLTGTDEHGQKVQEAAQKAGVTPQEHVDSLHKRFKELWVRLNICNDDFIRTTEEKHKVIVREILQKLYDEGKIYQDTYEGWYCMPCERFWTEKDLLNNNCPECSRHVDKIRESNYFFKMGQYGDWLADYIRQNEGFILPASRRNEVFGFLKKPLGDLCISRPKKRLPWGIPLPFDEDYVTYVWFDALINYISTHGTLEEIQRCGFLPTDHHLVGKDILTTHAVYWSTILKASGLKMPKNIFAHGWWTVNGKKMSKSLANVIEPNLLIDQFGTDAIRYFLMREVPFGLDGDFSYKALIGRINSDLANNFGNLLNRILKMIIRYFNGTVPESSDSGHGREINREFQKIIKEIIPLYEELAYSKILEKIWQLVDYANQYINNTEPWNLFKTKDGKSELANVMYNSAESLRIIAILIYPFMPATAEETMRQLGVSQPVEEQGMQSVATWGGLKLGTQTRPGEQLFPRIEEKAATEILATAEKAAHHQAPIGQESLEQNGLVTIDDFFKLDFRTGKILEAEKIKKSKKLLKLKVDIGSEIRQVVSGIAEAYQPEQLVGRKVILVANLKPAKLMGVESQGMVLAGSDETKIILAGFDEDLPNGARVK